MFMTLEFLNLRREGQSCEKSSEEIVVQSLFPLFHLFTNVWMKPRLIKKQ